MSDEPLKVPLLVEGSGIEVAEPELEELHHGFVGLQADTWEATSVDEGDAGADGDIYGGWHAGWTGLRVRRAIRRARDLDTAAAGSASGLSDAHRIVSRDMACAAALLGYKHRDAIHYSQDARKRWTGIRNNLKAWKGQYPGNADCSAYATWCLWNGLDHFGVRDVVNGMAWAAGYTGTQLVHGKPTSAWLMRGDLVIYGYAWPGEHVAIHVGGGMVVSHGSERGPLYLPLRYRSDVLAIRRYI